jgi:hypothetical protein
MGVTIPSAAGEVKESYEISNSLRFNAGDSAKLTRTQTAGDRKTFTFSGWVKRSRLGDRQAIISSSIDGSNESFLWFDTSDELFASESNEATFGLRTNRKFRDPSAWYHIVYVVDTTQGTAGDRVRIYVNGVEETSFANETQPSQNDDTRFNDNTKAVTLGFHVSDYPEYFGGYAAEYHFVDGSAKTPTDFGEFDDNGVWIPKRYTGTYGTNGYHLEFKQTGTSQNSSGIGADTSGQDNHFAVTNLAATDVTEDTCTNNFCTLSPLAQNTYAGGTLSEGNCEWTSGVSEYSPRLGTFGLSSGKWYWEIKPTLNEGSSNDPFLIGISSTEATANSQELGHSSDDWAYYNNGKYRNADSDSNYGDTYTVNDIIGVALDLDNSKLYFSKNGTFQNSGDPTSGSTGTGAISITSNLAATNFGFYFPALSDYDNSSGKYSRFQANFGNPPFAISSGNTDGKYGNFEYAVPSGYYALCTKRLAEFG